MIYYAIGKATDGGFYVNTVPAQDRVSIGTGVVFAGALEACVVYVTDKLRFQAEK